MSSWGPPIPLTDAPPPAFPVEVLPAWLRGWAEAEAEAIQVPIDLSSLVSLSLVSLAGSKRFEVELQPDGWTEPINLYTTIVAAPGEGKSPVLADAMAPLRDYERKERARTAAQVTASYVNAERLEQRRKKLLADAARATDAEADQVAEELVEAAQAAEAAKVLHPYRLVADDATPEALGVVLSQQGGRIGLVSSEGGPFEIMAGRYSTHGGPNLDLYLKAHVGDSYTVDRINRPPLHLFKPTLVVCVTIQPDVLNGLARTPSFKGRGLLGRFIFSLPRSRVGSRNPDATPMPRDVRAAYEAAIKTLLSLPTQRDEGGEIVSQKIAFTPAAYELIVGVKRGLEPRLGLGGDLHAMADWGNKLAGLVARLAGVLHLADLATESVEIIHSKVLLERIQPPTVIRAMQIGEYALAHAQAAFLAMRRPAEITDAAKLLAWMLKYGKPSITKRDAERVLHSTAEAAQLALAALEEHHHVRLQEIPPKGKGRPAGPSYDLHPMHKARFVTSVTTFGGAQGDANPVTEVTEGGAST